MLLRKDITVPFNMLQMRPNLLKYILAYNDYLTALSAYKNENKY